jgi:hypothetical protein
VGKVEAKEHHGVQIAVMELKWAMEGVVEVELQGGGVKKASGIRVVYIGLVTFRVST